MAKIPPQARELEEAVAGAIMIEKGAFDTLIDTNLKSKCFYVIINDNQKDMQQKNGYGKQ